jgi:hypothetical protein
LGDFFLFLFTRAYFRQKAKNTAPEGYKKGGMLLLFLPRLVVWPRDARGGARVLRGEPSAVPADDGRCDGGGDHGSDAA